MTSRGFRDDTERLEQFLRSDEFRRSGLTRRQFLARGGALALALGAVGPFLAACGSSETTPTGGGSGTQSDPTTPTTASTSSPPATSPAAGGSSGIPELSSVPEALKGSGEVRIATAGGALAEAERKAYFEPFTRLTGIKVVEVEGFSAAQVKTQVDSNNVQWDVVGFDYLNALNLLKQGDYFEEIDYDLIDTDNIDESQQHQFGVGYLQVGTVMCYRTDEFGGKVPQGWADFWNLDEFPGPRNWMSGSLGIAPFLEGALLADGVPMDQLYPLDIQRALDSLTKIRDNIVKFWESGAQSAQLMADKETVMGVAWNGRIATIQDDGAPVDIQWNQAMVVVDSLVIPKGAKNVENARKLIAFMTLPIPQAHMSSLIPYGFTNRAAAEYLPEDVLARLPSAPQYRDKVFYSNSAWWADNLEAAIEAWTEWSLT